MNARWQALKQYAAQYHLDALILGEPDDVQYFTSVGAGWLLMLKHRPHLFVFPHEERLIRSRVTGVEIVVASPHRMWSVIADHLAKGPHVRVGYTPGLSQKHFAQLTQLLYARERHCQMVLLDDFKRALRGRKDASFLEEIRHSCRVADQAYERVLTLAEEGMTEQQLAGEIEYALRRYGAERYAAPTMVSSGPNTTYPHTWPTDRSFRQGDLLVVDFSPQVGCGYADFSRTLILGRAEQAHKSAYEVVLRARARALSLLQPGQLLQRVHAEARREIIRSGYGRYFVHALGHAIGGGPDLSDQDEGVVAPGQVFALEPALYIPGWGGFKVEDVVFIEAKGPRVLTKSRTDLVEL